MAFEIKNATSLPGLPRRVIYTRVCILYIDANVIESKFSGSKLLSDPALECVHVYI